MTTVQVGLLGLGRLGTSISLALRRHNALRDAAQKFEITAYDPRTEIQRSAEQRGAADRYVRAADAAAADRDIVVMALPFADVQAGYRAVAPALRSDAVVLDISPLKLPTLAWSRKAFAENAHTIGISLTVNPAYLFEASDDPQHAQADLFEGGIALLMPDARAESAAVQLAADFSIILGATPHFMDAAEHDGIAAAVEGLSALLSAAYAQMLLNSDGWSDARRATNPSFAVLTQRLRDAHPDDLRDLLLLNRENVLRQLGALIDVLESYRETLQRDDRAAVEAALSSTISGYVEWLARRNSGRWDDGRITEVPRSSMAEGLFGGYLAKRLGGGKRSV